jgi:hypothetical protein
MPQVHRNPVWERLTPEPDGSRVEFQTAQEYKAKSVVIYFNGIRALIGFSEDVDHRTINMEVAPLTGDSLMALYDPR